MYKQVNWIEGLLRPIWGPSDDLGGEKNMLEYGIESIEYDFEEIWGKIKT